MLSRGEPVKHSRLENTPLAVSAVQSRVHTTDTVDDAVLAVQQQQVGPAANGLQDQTALHTVSQLVQGLQLDVHQTLQMGLGDRQDTAAGKVLAQEHTEHGGSIGVFPGQGGKLCPGVALVGGQQQLYVPLSGRAQAQDNLVTAGLIDLVDFSTGQGRV